MASPGFESSNASAESSEPSSEAAENSLSNPAVSEKFRQRMQPCQEPLWNRTHCPCCGRNFKDAKANLERFRESINTATSDKKSLIQAMELTENERRVLLSDNFLCRLLARCGGSFKQAQDRLTVALGVHRKYSLDAVDSCKVCSARPGYHSFRQVGFDRLGRPVLYTCINQDLETSTQPEQVREYFLHLLLTVLEAEKTIPESHHSLILVFDTNGLGMGHVRTEPVSQFGEMLRYFPARLCYALLLNLSTVTRFVLKPIIHLTGHQDDVLVLKSQDAASQLAECFDPPLVRWMLAEMERNKQSRMPFYLAPTAATEHDPRGEPAYVETYVKKTHPSGHRPHASIKRD